MLERNEDTICALSTPHGAGGIAVIRVSGPSALEFCKKISPVLKKKSKIESHRIYFSDIVNEENQKIDEVLFSYFSKGKSYTGDETVEISCHGSKVIVQQILDLLIRTGCRSAGRGEFTFRAFMNGKLDLVQAESVLALIESDTRAAAQVALRQLDGHVSTEFEKTISELTWCLAHIEASIDFMEQGIEVVDNKVLTSKLDIILESLQKLMSSYNSGKLLRDGVRVALIGRPNAGKSSLLNLLAQNDKAIVTPVAGTTRDVIETDVVFKGVKYTMIDTAGLRDTSDLVERIGIDRSKQEAEKSDLLCLIADLSEDKPAEIIELLKNFSSAKKLVILNKKDLVKVADLESWEKEFKNSSVKWVATSSLQSESRELLLEAFSGLVGDLSSLNEAPLSSTRQFEQTKEAFEMISKANAEIKNNVGAEFVAMYLKQGLLSLQKILGQVYDDQIMDRVFKEFCLGK